jgi:hypothetical protein
MSTLAEDRKAINEWDEYLRSLMRATVVDIGESQEDKLSRMSGLEKPGNDEEWFKYYFPNYYYADAAPFQKKSTRYLTASPECYIVRAWSRELAKDTRTMMEVVKAAMLKKKRSVLLISSSSDKAVKLLKPFKICFEENLRLINDYGPQVTYGDWTDSGFVTKIGCSFIAIGKGQTPRGLRNEEIRPDVLIMTDMDTDEDCRNPEMIDKDWAWWEKAAYPTRSISKDTWIIWLGNIIAENCCIKKAIEMADRVEKVNIRDEEGRSTWPQKNSETMIDRVLSKISYAAQQGEYFNNPVTNGKVFDKVYYGKMRPLREYRFLVCYCDPSYKKKGDFKAVIVIGRYKDEYHVLFVYCMQTTTAEMLDWHYEIIRQVKGQVPVHYFIEWPWIDDAIKLEIEAANIRHKVPLPLRIDERDKTDKYHRIESSLEPINRNAKLLFNEQLKGNPHMVNMEAQFLALSPTSRAHDDGPDAVEGGKYILDEKTINNVEQIHIMRKQVNQKRY